MLPLRKLLPVVFTAHAPTYVRKSQCIGIIESGVCSSTFCGYVTVPNNGLIILTIHS